MKVIDLLNKIAKGEKVPNKIKFASQIWKKENGGRNNVFYTNDSSYDLFVVIFRSNGSYSINDEVEIIEEDLIKEIPEEEINVSMSIGEQICAFKINELVKVVNNLKENK